MPFSYRKSVSLGSGTRMTFSKSGVSTSIGGKGYRVTTGPRGTYVTLGVAGIRYRQKIGGYVSQSSLSNFTPHRSLHIPYVSPTPIPTADVRLLKEVPSASTVDEMNAILRQPKYAWLFVLSGGVLGLLLTLIHPVFFVLCFGLGLYIASIVKQRDIERCTFLIEYDMDADALQKWTMLRQSLAELEQSQKLWRVITQDMNYDWKRHGGATSLLNRRIACVKNNLPPRVLANISPLSIDIGDQQIYFFPDRIYVLQGTTYGAIEYESLRITVGDTSFIESDGVPSDTQVIDKTWRYVNKNGGPDRRFNNNLQIPVVKYGVAEFRSVTGMNILLHISSVSAALAFAHRFSASQVRRQQPSAPGGYRSEQTSYTNENHNKYRQHTTAPQSPSPGAYSSCYTILGLSPNCTYEDAKAKYRELAMLYHPDRVSHMAPEFQSLATQKLQTINSAYAEVKRLRGW